MADLWVVLVTGSRFWDDVWSVKDELDRVVADAHADGCQEFILRQGACYPPVDPVTGIRPNRSADWLAHLWFLKYARLSPIPTMIEQERPADWEGPCRPACNQRTHRGRNVNHRRRRGTKTSCPLAGRHRNRDMVVEDPRPTLGLAFHRDNSGGTKHCIKTMREFGIEVRPVPYQTKGST